VAAGRSVRVRGRNQPESMTDPVERVLELPTRAEGFQALFDTFTSKAQLEQDAVGDGEPDEDLVRVGLGDR
jgi:hypothetical protein